MAKRVFIVHGWMAGPRSNWFPWLAEKLRDLGHEVFVPGMPNAAVPSPEAWVDKLSETVGSPDKDCYFVGHSLGVITILRYLEMLSEKKVGGAILVAGFAEIAFNPELSPLHSFFNKPLRWEWIKSRMKKKSVIIMSDNDYMVPLHQGDILKDNLGAKLIVQTKEGHFNAVDGVRELPVVLEEILKMME